MNYTIGEVAQKMHLSTHTLRYYDKEGLLPFVQKNTSGIRCFTDDDLDWIGLIMCLKETGMSIKDIKQYIEWYLKGDSTLPDRLKMFQKQYQKILDKQKVLQHYKEKIKYKITLYSEMIQKATHQ